MPSAQTTTMAGQAEFFLVLSVCHITKCLLKVRGNPSPLLSFVSRNRRLMLFDLSLFIVVVCNLRNEQVATESPPSSVPVIVIAVTIVDIPRPRQPMSKVRRPRGRDCVFNENHDCNRG